VNEPHGLLHDGMSLSAPMTEPACGLLPASVGVLRGLTQYWSKP
jgi:hypothetical protein